uniref:Uncharacterized protein n=1 Tax=Anopheles farauti TaxID=69004 RepID=A0A182Q264_9DIPT
MSQNPFNKLTKNDSYIYGQHVNAPTTQEVQYTIEPSFYIHVKNESLLYCLVFKSGTTTWFYNINRWAGVSEEKILDDKTDNFNIARQKYPFENPRVLLNSMKNTFSFIVTLLGTW